jgi:hypothetical protein
MIISILIMAIVFSGCMLSRGNSSQTATIQKQNDQYTPEIDAWCSVQEFNLTIIQNRTIVPVNDEDLKPFPEFGIYLHNVNDDPHVWNYGMRDVKTFDCNASRALQFLKLYRKYEEIPDQPVLEYRGHNYEIGFEYFHSGETYVPTTAESPAVSPPENKTAVAIGIALNDSSVRTYLTGPWTITDVSPGAGITFAGDGNEVSLHTPDVIFDTESRVVHVYVDMENRSVVYISESPKRVPMPVKTPE